jgi:hypothetical protein
MRGLLSMKNDYKIIHCEKCGSEQQHYKHWTCGEYTICFSCSNNGRKDSCWFCEFLRTEVDDNLQIISILLERGGKYEVRVKSIENNQQSTWWLNILPDKKAWKLLNTVIFVGQKLNGYEILSIAVVDH